MKGDVFFINYDDHPDKFTDIGLDMLRNIIEEELDSEAFLVVPYQNYSSKSHANMGVMQQYGDNLVLVKSDYDFFYFQLIIL